MKQEDRLAAWRIKNKLSQEAAARELGKHLPGSSRGVTQGTWASWEGGKKAPDLTNALAIQALTRGEIDATGWARARPKQRRHVRKPSAA